MTSVHLPLEGACLCGAVRVTLSALPLLTLDCHCRGCQKFSAGAFTLTAMFPARAFLCTGDLVPGGLGTGGRAHRFCAICKGFVFSELAWANDRINLRLSILFDAALFDPFVEVMVEEKLPRVSLPVRHSFARHPSSAAELRSLMDAYAETLQVSLPGD